MVSFLFLLVRRLQPLRWRVSDARLRRVSAMVPPVAHHLLVRCGEQIKAWPVDRYPTTLVVQAHRTSTDAPRLTSATAPTLRRHTGPWSHLCVRCSTSVVMTRLLIILSHCPTDNRGGTAEPIRTSLPSGLFTRGRRRVCYFPLEFLSWGDTILGSHLKRLTATAPAPCSHLRL